MVTMARLHISGLFYTKTAYMLFGKASDAILTDHPGTPRQ